MNSTPPTHKGKRPEPEYGNLPATVEKLIADSGGSLDVAKGRAQANRRRFVTRSSKGHKAWEWVQRELEKRIREKRDAAHAARAKRDGRFSRVLDRLRAVGPLNSAEVYQLIDTLYPGSLPDRDAIELLAEKARERDDTIMFTWWDEALALAPMLGREDAREVIRLQRERKYDLPLRLC